MRKVTARSAARGAFMTCAGGRNLLLPELGTRRPEKAGILWIVFRACAANGANARARLIPGRLGARLQILVLSTEVRILPREPILFSSPAVHRGAGPSAPRRAGVPARGGALVAVGGAAGKLTMAGW